MEKRKISKLQYSVDVEFNDDVYEKKHKNWLERRKMISLFLAFLILSIVVVLTSIYLRKQLSEQHERAWNNAKDNLIVGLNSNHNSNQGNIVPPQPMISKSAVIEELKSKSEALISEIRTMKKDGLVIEEDAFAKVKVAELQQSLRQLVPLLYGKEPYTVTMTLEFPMSMPDYLSVGDKGQITFTLAPLAMAPYSTYYFLDVVTHWEGGAFHRNAGHVLQALVKYYKESLAFQEYSSLFPHKQYTLGYAGRPGGPEFYISTVDNTDNHGPGSQGSDHEADSCFGRLLPTEENINTVRRMQKQPGRTKPGGFIDSPKNYIKIPSVTVTSSDSG